MSPAQQTANVANAQHSTGPRTDAGKSASAKNAVKFGLFATNDFIRPGEEETYAIMEEALHIDLVPSGQLEFSLVHEIHRALWRLRRCGIVEAGMVGMCEESAGPDTPISDPMQIEPVARLQLAVDRARAQCHRLLHKCTAELRKFQTERHIRNEIFPVETDLSDFGLSEALVVGKAINQQMVIDQRADKRATSHAEARFESEYQQSCAIPAEWLEKGRAEYAATKQTRSEDQAAVATARNAPCPCNSGEKYKRCCGQDAAPLLHAA